MTDFVNGLKSLSGLLVLTPEQSDFLHDAAEEMARLGGVGVAQSVGMREALLNAQKIIERDFPNGQLAIDIRNALAQQPTLPGIGECTDDMAHAMSQLDGYDHDRDMPGLQRWKDYWDAAVAAAPSIPVERHALPGHEETMANLDALKVRR